MVGSGKIEVDESPRTKKKGTSGPSPGTTGPAAPSRQLAVASGLQYRSAQSFTDVTTGLSAIKLFRACAGDIDTRPQFWCREERLSEVLPGRLRPHERTFRRSPGALRMNG